MEVIAFDKAKERTLRSVISRLHKNDAVLSYYQLQGLLFSLACSPEPIKPSEWFDLIWLTDEPQFDSEQDARNFYRQVVSLSEHIAEMAQQHRFLPFSARYSERWLDALSQWCEGLLMGYQYLEDLWIIALDDLNDAGIEDDVETTLSLASTFADLDGAKQMSFDEGMALTDEHLPEAYDLFWKVLAGYACAGDLWAEVHWEADTEQLFLALEPVAREENCPCGSGLVFAKCCLH